MAMLSRVVGWTALAGVLLVLGGCSDPSAKMFDRLNASDFGLGVYFGQTPLDVEGAIGLPQASVEQQGRAAVTDFYLPEDVKTTDSDTPQLALTFLNNKLERLYNRLYPEDPNMPQPPVLVQPLPGVKAGNRKSDFIAALGPATDPLVENEWRFKSKDGQQIVIQATFVQMVDLNEQRCSILQVVRVPAVPQLQGEEQQKQADWRKKVGLE
jgi:hypothetical protein